MGQNVKMPTLANYFLYILLKNLSKTILKMKKNESITKSDNSESFSRIDGD